MSEKLWEGRFAEKTHHSVEAFSSSIAFDSRLYAYDIAGSVAHCRMLAKSGIISDETAMNLVEGLATIQREIERGEFVFDDSLEDIHMHVETRLLQLVGKAAQELHTARSRNDQVALDVRMYLRKETADIIRGLVALREAIVAVAKEHIGVILPGYTHLQRAQPVLLAHHLMAYFEMFSRDAARMLDCLGRINVMPLGAAALAGTTYPIDRHYVAELLDFPSVSDNSMDTVADRDFVMEFLSAAAICMIHFSRLSEELILWASAEFHFIDLADAFSTGSSIMPQKKNPDISELTRGKTGRVTGNLVSLLMLMKSLPLAYNRDMQEDKEPLFDTVDTLKAVIDIHTRMLPTITFNRDVMLAAASRGYQNATDLADYLVTQGVPFRKAHSVAGSAVAHAVANGVELHEMPLKELKTFSKFIKKDVYGLLTPERMVSRRSSYGGTSAENVRNAIAMAHARLSAELERVPVFKS